ncbi:MarR family winged helix-turn-helix transcriptional regulator [Anaerocolumna sp.]|jgi:DNA-binding MarR family transcriptional regulator|uniref:MarR family winged helix-turn-helix transcriptional regulator n=1 Tax=Anaerocolumna sp. TaxID=2041569 RepID=UPI0028B1372C|nr:MarR family winged helix-turn-helix transcriptional regulator [Anaerocolumna sp.]
MKENINILIHFSYIAKTYWQFIQESMKDSSFSPNEMNLMLFLANNKADTAIDFVKETGASKSLLTRSVDSLTDQGYIRKEPDQEDRRFTHLKLTEKGEEIALNLRTLRSNFMKELAGNISEEEFLAFQEILEKMKQNILK